MSTYFVSTKKKVICSSGGKTLPMSKNCVSSLNEYNIVYIKLVKSALISQRDLTDSCPPCCAGTNVFKCCQGSVLDCIL